MIIILMQPIFFTRNIARHIKTVLCIFCWELHLWFFSVVVLTGLLYQLIKVISRQMGAPHLITMSGTYLQQKGEESQ